MRKNDAVMESRFFCFDLHIHFSSSLADAFVLSFLTWLIVTQLYVATVKARHTWSLYFWSKADPFVRTTPLSSACCVSAYFLSFTESSINLRPTLWRFMLAFSAGLSHGIYGSDDSLYTSQTIYILMLKYFAMNIKYIACYTYQWLYMDSFILFALHR